MVAIVSYLRKAGMPIIVIQRLWVLSNFGLARINSHG